MRPTSNLIQRERIGGSEILLVHTEKGYECRVYYLGEFKYRSVYDNEIEACQEFNRCCIHWLEAAERTG